MLQHTLKSYYPMHQIFRAGIQENMIRDILSDCQEELRLFIVCCMSLCGNWDSIEFFGPVCRFQELQEALLLLF
jgi:hypothetical protein